MKSLVFFDFCGTITATNNTYDFIFYFLKSRKKYFNLFFFFILDNLNIFKNLIFFIDKRKIELIIRKGMFFLLKGEKREIIYEKAREFSKKILNLGFYNKELINFIKKEGLRSDVYILSASINPVIEEFCINLPIKKIFSSKMIFDKNNIFNGEVSDYLFDKKKLLFNNFNKEDIKKSIFYTDNQEDIELNKYFKKIIKLNYLIKSINKVYSKTVNKKNYILTYIPNFYYFFSRPLSFVYFTNEFLIFFFYLKDFFISLNYYSYLLFFLPVYEISSLFNDYYAVKFEKNPTLRIDKNINFKIFIFILIRIFYFFILFFVLFKKINFDLILFYFFCFLTTLIGIIHSFLEVKKRIYSMILVRIFKLLPFYFLINEKINFFSFLNLIFIIQFFPIVLYFYEKNKLFLIFVKKSFFAFLLISLFLIYFDNRLFYPFLISFILRYLSFYNYLRKI